MRKRILAAIFALIIPLVGTSGPFIYTSDGLQKWQQMEYFTGRSQIDYMNAFWDDGYQKLNPINSDPFYVSRFDTVFKLAKVIDLNFLNLSQKSLLVSIKAMDLMLLNYEEMLKYTVLNYTGAPTVRDVMIKTIRALRIRREAIRQLYETLTFRQRVVSSIRLNRQALRFSRLILNTNRHRRLRGPGLRPLREAGELFHSWQITGDYSSANFDDDEIGGDGDSSDGSLFVSAMIGEHAQFGIGYTESWYEVDGASVYIDQRSQSVDLFINYLPTQRTAVGVFVNTNRFDIESGWLLPPAQLGRPPSILEDSYDTWGVGVMALVDYDIGERGNLGFGAVLTSTNKKSLHRSLDNEDSYQMYMIDYNHTIGSSWAIAPRATYIAALDNETPSVDGYYWVLGADVILQVTQNLRLNVGYEWTEDKDTYEEDRGNVGFTYSF